MNVSRLLSFRHYVVALAALVAATLAGAEENDAVLKQATERCARFETEVADMRMSQTMKSVMSNDELLFEQAVYTKGKKSRVEMRMPLSQIQGGEGEGDLLTVMINDGAHAWIISPFGDRKELSEEEAKRNEPARNCWGFFPDNARVIGSETVNGRDCHIVELEEEGVQTKLWLDKHNFIPVKGETQDSSGTEHYRWTHSDFRTIHGDWEYPYITEMFDGEELVASITVSSIDVNQGVSDDLFDPDKVETQPLDLEQLMKMLAPLEEESTQTTGE